MNEGHILGIFAGKLWIYLPLSDYTIAELALMECYEYDLENNLLFIPVANKLNLSTKAKEEGIESYDWVD